MPTSTFRPGAKTCENQSAHWPISYYAVYAGSGLEGYKKLAHDYVTEMLDPNRNPFMQTGYLQEAYGPDATYQGLTCSMLAQYWAWSKDSAVIEGLRCIYNFFNHTVAPEPDGYVWGASNFCHRTPYSWTHPQYGAGLTIMAGVLPEAGLWRKDADAKDPAAISRSESIIFSSLGADFRYSVEGYSDSLLGGVAAAVYTGSYFNWLNYPERIESGKLPVLESEMFTRNFNDEFFCIRRPGYYAVIYTGKPDPEWVASRYTLNPDQMQRRTGGGLSLFWTPDYGNLILSMNWSAYVNHMVRADLPDGKCSWPDYWSLTHRFDEASGALTTESKMINLPIQVKRSHEFREEELREVVELRFTGDVNVNRLVEQIPFLIKQCKFEDAKPISMAG